MSIESATESPSLTTAQHAMWLAEQVDPGNPALVTAGLLDVRGEIDLSRLQSAVRQTIDESDCLRLVFPDGTPAWVRPEVDVPLVDLRAEPDPEQAAHDHVRRRIAAGFADGPLFAFELLRIAPERVVLVGLAHHVLWDAMGPYLFVRRLAEVYTGADLPALPSSRVLVEEEHDYLNSPRLDADRAFWAQRLDGSLTATPLARRPWVPPRGELHQVTTLPQDVVSRLRALCWDARITWPALLMAAMARYTAVRTDRDDVVVILAVNTRTSHEAKATPGMRANFLPVPVRVRPGETVRELLGQAFAATRQTLRHRGCPTALLTEDRGPAPLGPTLNVLPPVSDLDFGTATAHMHMVTSGPVDDLQLTVDDGIAGDVTLHLAANPSVWTPDEVDDQLRGLVACLAGLAQASLDDPVASLGGHGDVPPLRGPVADTDPNVVLTALSNWATTCPRAIAVRDDTEVVSYGRLLARASAVADRLRQAGVRPGDVVGLCADRSARFVAAVLGVWLTGAAYVPADPRAPVARSRDVFADAGVRMSLVDDLDADLGVPLLLLDDEYDKDVPELVAPRPDQRAYVIFTSGSTGRPKGAMVHHEGMANHLLAKVEDLELGTADEVVFNAPTTFDISIWQMMAPLVAGGIVRVVSNDTAADAVALFALAGQEEISVLEVVPSVLRAALTAWDTGVPVPALDDLRLLVVTGEVLPPDLCRAWFARWPDIPLVNAYGPTECSDDVTHALIRADDVLGTRVPIGRAVRNTALYVLGTDLTPVPVGSPGELYVGGVGVGLGYVGAPERTAVTFLPDPFAAVPGARMYRTGDRVVRTPDGQLEFVERRDQQVKIRGQRVELGEVELALRAVGGVTDAAASTELDTEGNVLLVGHLVTALSPVHVRDAVAQVLPVHMIPSLWTVLDALPTTSNGKLDRAALPPGQPIARSGRAPATPNEQALCELFAETLGLPSVGADEHFIELGGHSLLATRLVTRIAERLGARVSVRQLFESPTPEALARLLVPAPADEPTVTHAPTGHVPLSASQQRLWFLNRLEPESPVYNVPIALRITGQLDVAALTTAMRELVRRHEVLRTIFPEQDGQARQVVLNSLPEFTLGAPGEDVDAFVRCGFDLTCEVPLRARLFPMAPGEHLLVVVAHHIAVDGSSFPVLVRDLGQAFAAQLRGDYPQWTNLSVQYSDFVLAQRSREPDLAHWLEELADLPAEIELPYDRPRPAVRTWDGGTLRLRLPRRLHSGLADLARDNGGTMFMAVHAAVVALLHKVGAGTDIPLGTAVADRGAAADLVGFFVNTVVLRADVSGDPSFRELLDRVRAVDLRAYEHPDVPLERLIDVLAPDRSLSRQPLFQVMLAFGQDPVDVQVPGLDVRQVPIDTGTAKFDLSIEIVGRDVTMEYSTDLFDHDTIVGLGDMLVRLLDRVVTDPDAPLSTVVVHDPVALAGPVVEVPAGTLHGLVEEAALRAPTHPAVVCADDVLTYAELNERANHLAGELVALGAGADRFVALVMSRGVAAIVAMLAVLKSGSAYLPIDPATPGERIAAVLADARPVAVIADVDVPGLAGSVVAETAGAVPGSAASPDAVITGASGDLLARPEIPVLRPGTGRAPNLDRHVDPGSAAYLIYTSGSTGRPKGVVLEHRAARALVVEQGERFGIDRDTRLLQFASFGFDAAVWEVFAALGNGGTVVVVDAEHRVAGPPLAELIHARRVNLMVLPPTVLAALPELPSDLTVIVAGEACAEEIVSRWAPRHTMINAYGPTEAAVCVTMSDALAPQGKPPIGRPLGNMELRVLDATLRPVPPGVAGDLYLAGPQLARGYLGRTDLTAERFVADPYGRPGTRMYRTGDRARVCRDGQLDFLGRADAQVKIRGFRVELGEIESMLREHVAQAAVAVRDDGPGGRALVAYVVSEVDAVDTALLREACARRLPDYMVPSLIVRIDEIPLTRNGKLDVAALPAPEWAPAGGRPPANERERVLCEVFADVLGVPEIGADVSFFDLGGDSVLAIQVVSRARAAGLVITPKDLFALRTPEALARVASLPMEEQEFTLDVGLDDDELAEFSVD